MTNETKTSHTPGPWKHDVLPNKPTDDTFNVFANGEVVSQVYGAGDANLIAAAPELLAELKRCRDLLLDSVNFDTGDKKTTTAVSLADLAIAKAEGKV